MQAIPYNINKINIFDFAFKHPKLTKSRIQNVCWKSRGFQTESVTHTISSNLVPRQLRSDCILSFASYHYAKPQTSFRQTVKCDSSGTEESETSSDAFELSLRKMLQRRQGLDEFAKEIQQEDVDMDLFKCALWIGQHRNPTLDFDAYLETVNKMAAELEAHLPPPDERYPLRMIHSINKYLFDVKGFKGNKDDYYNPDNSCIDKVIDTKLGIPISLSLLYMELAARVNFPMIGVNLPANFMIRPLVGEVEMLVDVFDEGKVLFVEDAEAVIAKAYGDGAKVKIERSFFQDNTIRPMHFLTRMLTNLKQIYFNSKDYEQALVITDYQQEAAATADVLDFNRRDKGILLYMLQRYPESTLELQQYLKDKPEAEDADRIQQIVDSMRVPFFDEEDLSTPRSTDNQTEKKDDDYETI